MSKDSDKHSPNTTRKKVRGTAKSAANAERQGHEQGQKIRHLARRHGLSVESLRLMAFGTLDDPAFVQEIRKAVDNPDLWELVAPAARDALVIPMAKVRQLGGSLDDLLRYLLANIEVLKHPSNRNFAGQTTPLEYVNTSLDLRLQDRLYEDASSGRRTEEGRKKALEARRAKALERGLEMEAAVEARRPGARKQAVYDRIARQSKSTEKPVKPESVRKRLQRHIQRQAADK